MTTFTLLDGLKQDCLDFIQEQNFDCLSLGVIDFDHASFECFEIASGEIVLEAPYLWFDLASLSKPLNLSASYLKFPELFDEEMLLLLEHRGGLKAWGLLSNDSYREQLLSYPIKESRTLYSDFSALRLMLEIEKKLGKGLKEIASYFWDRELRYWRDLPDVTVSPSTGWRNGWISGDVHDPNAFNIQGYTSHAGLFSTIGGLCRSLINLDKEASFVERVKKEIHQRSQEKKLERFVWGWDRAEGEETLAGQGCSEFTFGHLGFTGTMIWIDPAKRRGYALLTNATMLYCHERDELNKFRRRLGKKIWV